MAYSQEQVLQSFSKGQMPTGESFIKGYSPTGSGYAGGPDNVDLTSLYQAPMKEYYGKQQEGQESFNYQGKQMRAVRPGEALFNKGNVIWDDKRQQYLTSPENVRPDKGFTLTDYLAIFGMAAAPFAAGALFGGEGAGTAATTAAGATEAGGAVATPLTSTGLATGAAAPTGTALGTGGAGAFGGGSLEAIDAAQLAAQGLGQSQLAGTLAQSYGMGTIGSNAMAAGALSGMSSEALTTAGQAYNAYNMANKAKNVIGLANMLTGGGQKAVSRPGSSTESGGLPYYGPGNQGFTFDTSGQSTTDAFLNNLPSAELPLGMQPMADSFGNQMKSYFAQLMSGEQ